MAERFKEAVTKLISEFVKDLENELTREATQTLTKKIMKLLPTEFIWWILAVALLLLFITHRSALPNDLTWPLGVSMIKIGILLINSTVGLLFSLICIGSITLVFVSPSDSRTAERFKEAITNLIFEFVKDMGNELIRQAREGLTKKILKLLPIGFGWWIIAVSLFLLFLSYRSGPPHSLTWYLGVALLKMGILLIMG